MPLCSEERDSCCYERCPEHPLWISSSHAACGGRRKANLLLSQMHLSHSGLGSCDNIAITGEMSCLHHREPPVSLCDPLQTNRKRFSKQEAKRTANHTHILGCQLPGAVSSPAGCLPRSGDSSAQTVLCIPCGHLLASQQTFELHQH